MVGTRASTARLLAAAGPQVDSGLTSHASIVVDDDSMSVTSELSSIPDYFDETTSFSESDGNDQDDATADVDTDNESMLSHISVAAARIRAVAPVADDSDSELTELPEDYQDSVFDDGEADEDVALLDYDAMEVDMTAEELFEFDLSALDNDPQAVHEYVHLSALDNAAQAPRDYVHDQQMRDLAVLNNAARALREFELDQACMDLDDAFAGLDARIAAADDNNVLPNDIADDNNVPQDDTTAANYDEEFAQLNAQRANATPAQAAMLATYFGSGASMTFDELREALTMSDEVCRWPYGEDTPVIANEFQELMALKRDHATRAQALVIESHLGYGNTLSFQMFRDVLAWSDWSCETYLFNCFRGVYDVYMAEA